MNKKTRQKQIEAGKRLRTSQKTLYKCIPVNEMNKDQLQGLYNICTMKSGIIDPVDQHDLKRRLTGTGSTENYYIKLNRNINTPNRLTFLHYKGDKTKTEPNQIHYLILDGLKKGIYAISFLSPDSNGFYFIVDMNDTPKFIQMINKANETTQYQKDGIEYEYEQIEDTTTAYDIKHSYEYDKIFKLDEYDRKILFKHLKQAGLNKSNRKLLKQLSRGGKPFHLYVEELEEKIKALKEEEQTQEIQNELEKIIKEYWRVTEENNSWNNYSTTLEDYK